MLYCLIPLYLVLAGIICSSIEFSISRLMVQQLFLTWFITSWVLHSLFFLFSTSSILLLSLKCKWSLRFLYLFIGITLPIGGYQVSLAQFIIYYGRSTSKISIWIPINCLISSSVVAILFQSFWTLYKLVCSAMSLLRSLFQNIWN